MNLEREPWRVRMGCYKRIRFLLWGTFLFLLGMLVLEVAFSDVEDLVTESIDAISVVLMVSGFIVALMSLKRNPM